MINNNSHNLSFFDMDETKESFNGNSKLDVVKMEYIGVESIDWKTCSLVLINYTLLRFHLA